MRFRKIGASGGRVERFSLKVGPTHVTQVSFTTALSTRLNVDMTCTLEIKRTDGLSSLGDNSPSTIKKFNYILTFHLGITLFELYYHTDKIFLRRLQ